MEMAKEGVNKPQDKSTKISHSEEEKKEKLKK